MRKLEELSKEEQLEIFYKRFSRKRNVKEEDIIELVESLANTRVLLEFIPVTDEDNRLRAIPNILTNSEGKSYVGIYTSNRHRKKENINEMSTYNIEMLDLCIESVLEDDEIDGYVLNAFTAPIKITKPIIKLLIEYKKAQENILKL